MNNLFDIRDYVVVITGGTGVLGRCIGKYLALNGAKVVLLGRKAEVGAEIVADIQAEGGNAKFMKCDVMNQEMVQATCDAIVAEYGRVDTLLNAAGGNQKGATIGPEQNFFDLDPSQFQSVLNLNLVGTVIPTQVFLKPMVTQGKGSIINFSSMAAFRGQDVIRQTPFGRMGQPEELCGTIHYLMSDASKFVTGTVAVVDGGFNIFAM